ncbi:MAG: SusD/RagB family nutrient-binding outer membrane lipoprotein [Bacteroidales bacterium]|nr:SusD/RagB family nutrient-binding outer membrane lipoprotein [Bacteroidales bacterium]
MKKLLYSILSLILIFGATSCENWLDVNTDPDSPNSLSATVEIRLPWIQYYYAYAYGCASVRTNASTQMITSTSRTGTIGRLAHWNPNTGPSTTPYQNWFVGAAVNIPDIIEKSAETGATHYEAAALVIKSMGYVMMADLYGEMPYTYAVTAESAPVYDTGDVIYEGCIADLDRAIELFSQPQQQGAVSLAEGDTWNGGDVNKWIKLCYGLKARWLNNFSKTSKYDPEAILAAINNGPKSNSDNTKMTHYNVETAGTCITVGDAYGPCVVWDTAAWGTGQRLLRWYANLLTNFKGTGVEDPRADKLLPHSMINVQLSEDGSRITSHEWLRDCGIDIMDVEDGWLMDRHAAGNTNSYLTMATENVTKSYKIENIVKYFTSVDAFVENAKKYYKNATFEVKSDAVDITYHPGAMYVNDVNPIYVEDVKYVQLRADGLFETSGLSATDMCCYYSAVSANTRAVGLVQGTGAFYTRPDSDTDFMTYSEMCFIKSEVLFRKGDKAGAYAAYKEGILSHFARMNEKLNYWTGIGCGKTALGFDVSFAYAPMSQADIDAYMASAAVKQNSAELTLSDIMMQKFIAMGFNYQNWNDMRRYNYYAGNIGSYGVIYTEMKEPAYRTQDVSTFSSNPNDDAFFLRRWQLPSLETNYNSKNANALFNSLYGIAPTDYTVYSIPVAWDRAN